MASPLLRRSGVAVGLIVERLGWKPDLMYQVGVGFHHEETDVLKHEWPDCQFIGFEPHPDSARKLEDYPGRIIEVALSDFQGTASLQYKVNHKDGSSLHSLNGEGVKSVAVNVTTLDSLSHATLYFNTLLWIDCEGNELQVLRGGINFLKQVQVVNVEMTSNPPGTGWCKPEDVHRLLVEHGFWLEWIHTNRSVAGQCDCIYVREHLFKPEYCCVPHEKIRWENR